jgi:hypothetical protein
VIKGAQRLLKDPVLKAVVMEINGCGRRHGFDDQDPHNEMHSFGFGNYFYDPWARELSPSSPRYMCNTIFVRDLAFVEHRLGSAKPFHALGYRILCLLNCCVDRCGSRNRTLRLLSAVGGLSLAICGFADVHRTRHCAAAAASAPATGTATASRRRQTRRPLRLASTCRANRKAIATIVKVGLACPEVGNVAQPAT